MDSAVALEKAKKQLHESGFKLTPQREVTILVLLENERGHLSAKGVYFLAKQKSPEIGLATVHRALGILTSLKVADKMGFNDGSTRYDLRKGGAKHFHHHLLYLECGIIEEVEKDLLSEIEQIIESQYHFLVKDHRLTFHGICQSCQNKY